MLLLAGFGAATVFLAMIGAVFVAVLSGLLSAVFGWIAWRGGSFGYRIDQTGLHVSPARAPERSVPIAEITGVEPYIFAAGLGRVTMLRVRCADGSDIDLPMQSRGQARQTKAAFRAVGVPVREA